MPTKNPNRVPPSQGDVIEEYSFHGHLSQLIKASSYLQWRTVLLILIASLAAALLSDKTS